MTNLDSFECLLSANSLILILFILFNSLVVIKCDESQDEQPIVRVQIDWDALPEPFSNDKIPSKVEPTKRQVCYNLIGCYEQIPTAPHIHHDPVKLKTEFLIHSRNQYGRVKLEKVENCIKDQCEIYPFNLGSVKSAPFRPNRRTIILIGGYLSKSPTPWQTKMKDLWLALEDVNVIITSWPKGNRGLYADAVANSRPVARHLVVLLYYLAQLNKLDLKDESFAERFHIVGHSIGAHIAGFVGQDLASMVGRITGLDAAGPDFDNLGNMYRLDKTDAKLVDALHTNSGAQVLFESYYGTSLTNGHIDLYANDGRRQPGCESDRFGCSHKRATHYFVEFLVNQLKIREQLKDKPASFELNYRLTAYSSPSYQEFHNGSALANSCPITILDNRDLNSDDLNNCSIPIDYVTGFKQYREELQQKHSISFDPNESNSRKYFFYTGALTADELRDHYLLKVQASEGEKVSYSQGCNIVFDISMRNGLNTRFTAKDYKLIPEKNEYEIVLPFLAVDSDTKIELAKLDLLDYYQNDSDQDREQLVKSLLQIFPSSITMSGAHFVEEIAKKSEKKSGVVGFLKNLFDIGSSTEKIIKPCELDLDSITVQPLRRLNRHLVATYSDKYRTEPDVVVLKDGDESTRKSVLKDTIRSYNDDKPEFFINKVIIGPYDGPSMPDVDPPAYAVLSQPVAEEINMSSTTWFVLYLIVFVLMYLGATFLLFGKESL